MLKKLKLLKKLFFKSDDGHAISRQEKRRLPKSTARFPAKKRWHSLPPSGCLGTSLPLPQSLYGRTDGRMDGRTLTSQPKFFASTHYQISLAMELRWRALPAGSAIKFEIAYQKLRALLVNLLFKMCFSRLRSRVSYMCLRFSSALSLLSDRI